MVAFKTPLDRANYLNNQSNIRRNLKVTLRKTKKDVISEIIAVLCFVILTLFSKAYSCDFNVKYFLEQVESFHLKDEKVKAAYTEITDLRKDIKTYIGCSDKLSPYIDKTCTNNIVGETMMKLLIANMKVRKAKGEDCKLEILYGDGDKCEKKKDKMHIKVLLNENGYTPSGISNDILCGINKNMRISPQIQSYSDILFHELGHALHHLENKYVDENYISLNKIYNSNIGMELWTDDEELYNITGKFYNGSDLDFDPLNCNMFDICNRCKLGKPIVQRVFHKTYRFKDKAGNRYWIEDYYKGINILDKIDIFLIDTAKYLVN